MDQESRWAAVRTIESNWAKRSQLGPGSSWASPILAQSQIRPRSQDGSEQIHDTIIIINARICK